MLDIEYRTCSIFGIDAEAYVNPVNCVGVSGAGLALKFKNKYPDNFDQYYEWCVSGEASTGKILVVETNSLFPKYIINLPTKQHWKFNSKPEWIKSGLHEAIKWATSQKIASVAIPMLGCGLGGLDWEKDVKPIYDEIFKEFSDQELSVVVLI